MSQKEQTNKQKIVIYWSRRDFRLNDNPALAEAINYSQTNNLEFLPIYILDNGLLEDNKFNIGTARREFLAVCLEKFAKNFKEFLIFQGNYKQIFENLLKNFEIELFVNEDIEPYSKERDNFVKKLLESNQNSLSKLNSYHDQLTIFREIRAGSGNLYSVFTPFKNAVLEEFLSAKVYPMISLKNLQVLKAVSRESLNLLKQAGTIIQSNSDIIFKLIDKPNILHYKNSDGGDKTINIDDIHQRFSVKETWYTSEEEALIVWQKFLDNKITSYKESRDGLGMDTLGVGQTSKMSVALKWGLVSVRYLKQSILEKFGPLEIISNSNLYQFIAELIWREFYRYILYHRPSVLGLEYQLKFQNKINWEKGEIADERFLAWIKGETGYKVVDASMNQLAKVGWMHNRSRMIVASILTKNLGIDWRWGQEYFRLVLLDLDEASNNGGWQWGSSTGSDPKPIRIFNPYLQTENYDKESLYQNKWLPKNYNHSKLPIIEHKLAREQALIRYNSNNFKITPRDS